MRLRLICIGKGGAGVGRAFESFAEKMYYLNTHKDEMDLLEGDYFSKGNKRNKDEQIKLCIDGSGTGRSPGFAETLAQENKHTIRDFLEATVEGYDGFLIVTIGGGGGTGTGFAPVVCGILDELRVKFGVIYTLPLNQEGSPTIPNSINGLHNLVKVLKGTKVSPFFIVDNQLLFEEEEHTVNHWQAINERISKIMLFLNLTEAESTDIETFNTLDEREFVRIFRLMRAGNDVGFNDIKSFKISLADIEEGFKEGMKETNLSMAKGYDYASCEGMLVVVERPRKHGSDDVVPINELFELISRKFKGKRMLKSVVNTDTRDYKVNILFSGMNLPTRINKLNTTAKKLIEKGKTKREAKATASSVNFKDDFEDWA
jgi:cell division GTPase FtsZ